MMSEIPNPNKAKVGSGLPAAGNPDPVAGVTVGFGVRVTLGVADALAVATAVGVGGADARGVAVGVAVGVGVAVCPDGVDTKAGSFS